jgi:TRAP-type C4-dicarboxylate transport system permease small subunit
VARRALDLAFKACGVLAGMFLVLIAVVILAQVFGRMAGRMVPGADELAGFFLAASSFLALAYTLRTGGHIRVTLFIGRLAPGPRRLFEAGCLALAAGISGYFAWHAVVMTWESWVFGDRAIGVLPTPLWIPQLAVVLGLAMLTLALAEALLDVLQGRMPSYRAGEDTGPGEG